MFLIQSLLFFFVCVWIFFVVVGLGFVIVLVGFFLFILLLFFCFAFFRVLVSFKLCCEFSYIFL